MIFFQGKQNLINNNFDEAIKLFQEILKLNMKHIESHYYLGFALLHKNQYEPAIEVEKILVKFIKLNIFS